MLTLAVAIALGIIIAVVVLNNLESILGVVGGIAVFVLIAAIVGLLLWVALHAFGAGYSMLGPVGPWLLLTLVLAGWAVTVRLALKEFADALRQPVGKIGGGWSLAALATSFAISLPLYEMEEGQHQVLDSTEMAWPWRVALVSPVLLSLVLVAVVWLVSSARHLRAFLRRASRSKVKLDAG